MLIHDDCAEIIVSSAKKTHKQKGFFDLSQGSAEEVHKDWFHCPLASVRPPGITLL